MKKTSLSYQMIKEYDNTMHLQFKTSKVAGFTRLEHG